MSCPPEIAWAARGWLGALIDGSPAYVTPPKPFEGPGQRHLAPGFGRDDHRPPPKAAEPSLVGTDHLVLRRNLRGEIIFERWHAGNMGPLDEREGLPIIGRIALPPEHQALSLADLCKLYEERR